MESFSNISYKNETTNMHNSTADSVTMGADFYNFFTDSNLGSDIWGDNICFGDG